MNTPTAGRYLAERDTDTGLGMLTSPVTARHWDVQNRTGWSTSTVQAGQWFRGVLMRGETPVLVPPDPAYLVAYDSTDPRTWG